MTESPSYWQRVLRSRSALVLIAANLIPLFGVLFAGWSAFDVVFLFWLENAVIGFFNVCKLLTLGLRGNPHTDQEEFEPYVSAPLRLVSVMGMLFVSAFFTFHYGMFMFVHGIFIVALLAPRGPGPVAGFDPFDLGKHVQEAITGDLAWPFLALFASHAFSFAYNFLGRREYARVSGRDLMTGPYARVVIMHLAILFGGILSLFLPHFIVVLLILMKLGLDLAFHLKEHETGVIRLLPKHGQGAGR